MISRFFFGFKFIFDGISYLRKNDGLKKWALMPFLLIIALFLIGVVSAFFWAPPLTSWLTERFFNLDSELGAFVIMVLTMLFVLVLAVLYGYLMYLLVSLVSAPFHSVLSEKVLQRLGATNTVGFKFSFLVDSVVRVLVLGVFGILLVLGSFFIPGLNIVSAFFLFFMIAYDSADYSLEVLGYSLKQRFGFVKTHLAEFFGMATFVGLTLFVPGLILLLMPAAVTGSTILVFQLHKAAREVA